LLNEKRKEKPVQDLLHLWTVKMIRSKEREKGSMQTTNMSLGGYAL
jgi:hypothetical protein